MAKTPSTEYLPKAGMCSKCTNKHSDCSNLDFRKMKQIQKIGSIVIVKCSNFKRRPMFSLWLD